MALSDEKSGLILESILRDFSDRHQDLEGTLIRHFEKIGNLIENPESLTHQQKLLLGAFFTKEYSIESVAVLLTLSATSRTCTRIVFVPAAVEPP